VRTLSGAAAAAALVLTLTVPAGAAQARGNDWTRVTTLDHARLQACRDATTKDGPWKIRLRVNAKRATTAVKASAEAQKQGEQVGRTWRSGWIRPGQVSTIGTVRLPRGSAYQLATQLESHSSGVGVVGSGRRIGRC